MLIRRIVFVKIIIAIAACITFAGKVPFEVLYNHDGSHTLNCIHPWREKGEDFSEEMFIKSIEELVGKGVDAVAFNPGNGAVPWWNSNIYADHFKWFVERTGKQPSSWGRYIMQGGDMVKVFVDTCRKNDLIPMITLRLKDEHALDSMDNEWISKFIYENQHLRLDPSPEAVYGYRGLNWMYPKVPAERLAVIRELSENYDIDGIELDFMRFFPFFNLDETGYAQRRYIMHNFIRDTRRILDDTAKNGRRRYLSIRVPNRISEFKRLGIDLGYLDKNNLVDIINISPSYLSQTENELALFRSWAPNTSIFFEMTHAVARDACLSWGRPGLGGDGYPVRFTTPQKYITMANLAWARDVDGLSLFNVIYTRPGNRPDGQVHGGSYNPGEPPWGIFKRLTDVKWLARQPQNYWINHWWKTGYHGRQFQLPKTFVKYTQHFFTLDIALPSPGVEKSHLRLMTSEGTPQLGWRVLINNNELTPCPDVSEPFEDPYGGFLGEPVQYSAFIVNPEFLKEGQNEIRVSLEDAPIAPEFTTELMYIDLAVYPENQ